MNKEKEIENGWENLEEKIERIMATVQQIKNKADYEVITQDQNIQPIFNDYPDFLVDNNKESIEEEDEDEYVFNIEG